MSINTKKSCCLRIGPRFSIACSNLVTANGRTLPWVTELRYLGVYIVSSLSFRCSIDHAKKSYFRATNAIFGKIGRLASEEDILRLFVSKCVPILLYGLEAFPINKSLAHSLDFTVNRFFMKLFKTNSVAIIAECQRAFNYRLPSTILVERCGNLQTKTDSLNLSCIL
jgi:hypothetical protein